MLLFYLLVVVVNLLYSWLVDASVCSLSLSLHGILSVSNFLSSYKDTNGLMHNIHARGLAPFVVAATSALARAVAASSGKSSGRMPGLISIVRFYFIID